MAHLIDYAGLFPPARLPLPEAIQNYARYRQQPERWMLSRFIVPSVQLDFLTTLGANLFREDDPFTFSVLGRGGRDSDEFLDGLSMDLEAIASFRQGNEGRAIVDVFETRLPALSPSEDIAYLVAVADEQLDDTGLTVFYEVPFGPDWEAMATDAIKTIAEQNARRDGDPRIGFKLRCGGVEASAFPSPGQVATALLECRSATVPLKATAGLHHPIRRFDEQVQTKMHGFLNVFGAGLLACAHYLSHPETEAIIEDENAAHFVFTPDRFAWGNYGVSTGDVADIRRTMLLSFGSCSFDEPREDLQALGLLKRTDAARR